MKKPKRKKAPAKKKEISNRKAALADLLRGTKILGIYFCTMIVVLVGVLLCVRLYDGLLQRPGLYLPITGLVLMALAISFKHHRSRAVWKKAWDAVRYVIRHG